MSAAERQKVYRLRRKRGTRILRVPVNEERTVALLRAGGYIDEETDDLHFALARLIADLKLVDRR